jgi:hypothetical protein
MSLDTWSVRSCPSGVSNLGRAAYGFPDTNGAVYSSADWTVFLP